MALSATFTANFASFYAAVDKADAKLKTFGDGADKVGGRLSRMGDQFSGQKIVQEATIMAKAVEQIGGVSKLTEKELARLGATTNEAVAKMKLLGMDVPKNLQDIADKTKGAGAATTDWLGSLTKVAAAVGIAFSVGAIKDFVASVFDAAGAVKDLSDQWGVSTKFVQQWSAAANQSGVETEQLGKSIQFMTAKLEESDAEYDALLKNIGLSGDALRKMSTEDAYKVIIDKIAGIEDATLQLDVAMGILGPSAKKVIGGIRDGMHEAADAQKFMSDETIKRLEAAGDAWTKFKNLVVIHSGEMLGAFMKDAEGAMAGWGKFFGAVGAYATGGTAGYMEYLKGLKAADAAAAAAAKRAAEAAKAATEAQGKLTTGMQNTAKVVDDLKTKTEALAKARAAAQKDEERYQAWKEKVLAGVSKQLLEDEKRLLKEGYFIEVDALRQKRTGYDVLAESMKKAGAQYKNLLALPPLPPDFIKVGTPEQLLDIFNQQTNTRLKTGAGSVTLKDAPKLVRDYSAAMVVASQVTRTLAGVTSKTWGGILQGAESAITMIFQYKVSMTAAMKSTEVAAQSAAAAAQLMWAAFTMGASLAIGAVTNAIAQANAARAEIKKLRAELVALGEDESTLPGRPSRGRYYGEETIPALNKILDTANARIAAVDIQIGKLTQATERFGGMAPAALRPFIESLQTSARLTEEQRALLEGMAATPTWRQLEQTATDYGIALEGLGAQFQQSKIGELADQYFTDFQNLVDAGADANAVLAGMADEVQGLLTNAMKFGSSLPAFMKPMLEDMVKMGLLTDAAGNKLEDLSTFNFTDSIESSFEKMRLILEDIRDLLAVAIPQAALTTGRAVDGAFGGGGGSAAVIPNASVGPSAAAAAGGNMTLVVEADGRVLSRLVAPFIPGEVRRYSLGRS